MAFKVIDGGFEHQTIEKKQCQVLIPKILEIAAFTEDLLTTDERRISIETTDGITYLFSEEEPDWDEFTQWVGQWAKLENDWYTKCYSEPFSQKRTTLWRMGK